MNFYRDSVFAMRNWQAAYGLLAALAFLNSCSAAGSRIEGSSSGIPAGSHRVAAVGALATRDRIVATSAYQKMLNAGIGDSKITNGSMAAGQVYCCGDTDKSTAIWFYVPAGVKLEPGDIVEVQMAPDENSVNTALKVREKANASPGQCHWVPPDEKLWRRVLYCDWMASEGWVEEPSALHHTWYKPPA